MKVNPNPLFAAVEEWPHILEGTIDIADAGFSSDVLSGNRSQEEVLASFHGAATLNVSGKGDVIFVLDGSVLLPSMIWPEEIDSGIRFRVSLEPIEGESIPSGDRRTGKLLQLQLYKATQIDRA